MSETGTGSETGYSPGECNIGRAERLKRLGLGIAGLAAAAAVFVAVVALSLPDVAALLTVVPLFGGLLGVLQWQERFCVGFGLRGVYDVSGGGDDTRTVDDEEAQRADRYRAVALAVEALVGATVLAALAYLFALVL